MIDYLKGPKMGLFKTLLLVCLLVGYIRTESEKDFQFDDEDFLADEASSGEGSGEIPNVGGTGDISNVGGTLVVTKPTGIPALYRAVINVTSVDYTDEIAAAGRDIAGLALTQRLQDAIQKLLNTLPGNIRIRIVDLQPGSLMVTFDIDTDGQQTEEEVVALLNDVLKGGNLNGYRVSDVGFDFRQIRDAVTCSPQVGREPTALPETGNLWANLMINFQFPCSGYVVGWRYYRSAYYGESIIGVFRQISDTEFALVSKTKLPSANNIGMYTTKPDEPILVRKGYFIGVFHAQGSRGSVIPFARSGSDASIPDSELFQNYYMTMYESDLVQDQPFKITDFVNSENQLTYALQAEMSYLNVPDVEEGPPKPRDCNADEWKCANGECVPGAYRCDSQRDCYDGSDEDNCPAPSCPNGEFQCADRQQCLPVEFVCNFVNDCGDGSDELNCGPGPVIIVSFRQGTQPSSFMVSWIRPQQGGSAIVNYNLKYRKVSVRSDTTLDGDYIVQSPLETFKDVVIESDQDKYILYELEAGSYYEVEMRAMNAIGESEPRSFVFKTASAGCVPGEWQCRDGGCIPLAARCDFFPGDCADDSDEDEGCVNDLLCSEGQVVCRLPNGTQVCRNDAVGCVVACSENQFQCLDGFKCISFGMLCDGRVDCDDYSDESNCECAEGEFQCVAGRQCISGSRRCDGTNDCDDSSDEENCPCPTGTFQCTGRRSQCVTEALVCDGARDCDDGSDELNCPTTPQPEEVCPQIQCPQLIRAECRKAEFVVGLDGKTQCRVCDSDICEKCPSGQWGCADGSCIPDRMRCDGVPQCEDSSDEIGCPAFATPPRNVVARSESSQSITVNWDEPEGVNEIIQGYVVYYTTDVRLPMSQWYSVRTGGERSTIIGNLQMGKRYSVVVGAYTSSGEGPLSNVVQVVTRQGLPSAPSVKVVLIRSDPAILRLTWERPQVTNGVITGYKLTWGRSRDNALQEVQINPNQQFYDTESLEGGVEYRFQLQAGNAVGYGSKTEVSIVTPEGVRTCRRGQWGCADGSCIPDRMRCDGVPQCEDSSDEIGCPAAGCTSDQFTCADGNCVESRMRCDGVPQCEDSSDEDNCPCRDGMFQCRDGLCVEGNMKCDGVPQCEDGSDEEDCPAVNCPASDFQCTSTVLNNIIQCIDKRLQCDGYEDCSDGSDENNCPGCRAGQFECKRDGRCLPDTARCNGSIECSDRSDELECVCTANQFRCGDGICIDLARRCNRQVDCSDRSDELACPCQSGEFQCVDGECIPEQRRCDKRPDCRDRSDEENCPNRRTCPEGFYVCGTGHCLSLPRRCDGRSDCPDGSDERNCSLECAADEVECVADNKCLTADQICNRVYDCSDRRDELNCARCTQNEFQCNSDRSCISAAGRCNGRKECSDGSDEMNCPSLPPISVEVSPKNLRIRAGAEAIIFCNAQGLPQDARLEWVRRGGELPMQSAVEGPKLMIPVAKPMDSGDYVCKVVGVPGSYEDIARLEVVAVGPQPTTAPGKCGRDEAVCQNGQCIRREYRCDGEPDCTDGSDEPEDCFGNLCEPNEFQCPSGQCVMKIWRCDGENDCDDGFDESNCASKDPNEACGYDEFQCLSGDQCIPLAYQCDQEIDCLDRSDEIGCSPPVITLPPVAEIEVELGATFTIICEAVGVPMPLIVWRLNWGNIPTGDRVTTTSSEGRGVLTIADARYEDAGAYTCEAINNRGSIFAIPDALVIVTRQKGPCEPPFFNFGATTTDDCVRCFCFGRDVQCFSSDLQVSNIGMANAVTLVRRDQDDVIPDSVVNFKASTREYQVLDFSRSLRPGSYYFQLPREFLGERLTSYGGELKYTIFYDTDSRRAAPTSYSDVIITGNGITLYYRARTQPNAGVPTSVSVPLIETAWERYDGTIRGDTPITQFASREEFMTVLQNVEEIQVKANYDNRQSTVRIGGVFMTTAVDYSTEFGRAYLVEECQCPTGYTGLSCQTCAAGFTRIQSGGYLGQCSPCNCNGHSNDCDTRTGECLNCQHNSFGPQCQICADGYYGDARGGTPNDCRACPCPLTEPANQFSRTCFLESDGEVTCGNCPLGYEGRRCEKCSDGYNGDPLTPGSSCVKINIEQICDSRGSLSVNPDPLTRRCRCKENVVGNRCDSCKANTFYLNNNYNLGCIRCFCMGMSKACQSTYWSRSQTGVSFSRDEQGVSITDSQGQPIDGQRLQVDGNNREVTYRTPRGSDIVYWSLPARFLGNKVTAYGGSLRFTMRYNSRQGTAVDSREPFVMLAGNEIILIYRQSQTVRPNRPQTFNVVMYEQNWYRADGQPATREHLLMALADLDSILIRASFEEQQADVGLRDVTLDIAENRRTRQDRAYAVEQCVCPVGYKGLSCEDCDTGYTRSGAGVYLGLCEPCNCNGHSSECDSETGVCRNCQHNTAGDYCDRCAVGYYGNATRGTRNDCQKCPCPLTESPNQFSPTCDLAADNQVTCSACPAGHTGRRCETCISGYTGNPMKPGDYCRLGPVNPCDCDTRGTVPNTQCDQDSKQCQCKPYTQGRRCARCREGYFYLESDNAQGCLTCYCSGITNQCTSSSYYRDSLRPVFGNDGSHNFVLLNRRMNNIISDGFIVDTSRNAITFNQFEGIQQERESLFFQLPAKFRGDQVTSYGGYLRFTLEFSARPEGRMSRDVDLEIISDGQALRLYNLFEPALQEGKTQTYEILLRESSFRDLRSNTGPTRATFMTILSNVEGILIRATYHTAMASVTLKDVSMDTAIPSATDLGGAQMVEDCRCPEGYTGLSCQRCAQGYLRVSDGRGGLGRCVKCNCNGHASSCDPDSGRCLDCQHNTEGDRCEVCSAGFYGDATSGTPNDCRKCPCPLTSAPNQFSRTCLLAEDSKVTCDRCPTGYTGRQCEKCAQGYTGDPSQPGDSCRPVDSGERPEITVSPIRVEESLGSTAVFQCVVGGPGPFRVVWSRLDSRRLPDRAYVNPRYTLTIRDLKPEDTGRYVCDASNAYGVSRGTVTLQVNTGPSPIQVRIENPRVEIEEGRTARLVCTAVSTSREKTYILSWSKQGSQMPAKAIDQTGVLIIPNVQQSDAGNYVCMGSDMFTMDEQVGVLIVTDSGDQPPSVRIEPRYQTVEEGSQARFACIATGSPTPKIEWYRGGDRQMNPEATISNDGIFIIPRVSQSDESDYYCKATNSMGTTEVRTILYVKIVKVPEITVIVRRTSYVVVAGQTARLECYTDDTTGRVTLFWSRSNGLPVGSSQEEGVLTIPDVQKSFGGKYVCTGTDTITGRFNTVTSTLEVNVEELTEAPTVTVEPEKLTIPMGTTGTLRCVATGIPQPTVTWIKSREELAPNHQVTGNSLRITQASMTDRGIYVCRAENSAGMSQDWAVVEVERRMRPKIDIYPNVTQTTVVGGSVLFQCRVMDGDPPPTVKWSRVGGLPISEKTEVMDNGVIMFKDVSQTEQGSYICTATNDMGTITTTVTLIVQGPPSITLQPSQTVYALIGERVTLECTAQGEPTPQVYWVQPSKVRRGDLPPDVNVAAEYPTSEGTAILDITSVKRDDQGYYKCVASNDGGQSEENVQLVVRDDDSGRTAGVKISGPSTLSVVEGQSVELVCSAEAIPGASIRWSRREGALPPGHTVRGGILTIPQFRAEYGGEYICSTVVTAGRFQASVFIIITVAPRLNISPQRVTARAGETIILSCAASGSGPFDIEWMKVDGQMNPRATERDGTLEIRQATAADAGRYRCVVRSSSAGTSDGYAIVEIEVPPQVVVTDRNIRTTPGNTAELRCTVTGTPAPVVRWDREIGDMPAQHRVQNGILTIYNVQPEDSGRYICTASSSAGSTRDYGVLTVDAGGVINGGSVGQRDTQIVNVGDRVSMECIVTGTPLPRITWSRDDGDLPRGTIVGDGVLIIPQAKVEDAGTYTCLAVNEAGSVTSKVTLYVRVSNQFTEPYVTAPSATTAALGDKVSLVCEARGYPSPDITWMRKDGEMPDDYTIVDGNLWIMRVRPEDAGTYVCQAQNQYGKTETPVDLAVGDLVPYFSQDPNSYMSFKAMNDVYLDFDILLSLRPESSEGMVLYNGQFEDGGGDFVCFGLKEGYPEFRFDVGSGPAVIRGNQTLNLNQWHTIKLKRNRKQGEMVVNDGSRYTGQSPGYFTGLDLTQNMYLGSVPDYNNIPQAANFKEGFVGSISEVKLKGIDLNLGAEALEIVGVEPYNSCYNVQCQNGGYCMPANTRLGSRCICKQGYTGDLCQEKGMRCHRGACGQNGRCYDLEDGSGFRCICPVGKTGAGCNMDISIINPFFNRTSFISYPPAEDALFSLTIYVEFKPYTLSDGIILYEGNSRDGSGDYMALVQKDGYLEFRFDTGSGPAVVRSKYPLRLNEWTRVTATRTNRDGTLIVNSGDPVTAPSWPPYGVSPGSTVGLNLKLPLYLGGPDPTYSVASSIGVSQGFIGCVAELQVNDKKVDLLNDAIESVNIVDCGERRLCERQPCENDATCEDLPGPDYRCICPASHTGKNCEVEINICLTNSPCRNGAPCSITDDGYRCDCPLGYAGDNCQNAVDITTAMSFAGDSFIEFNKDLLPHSNSQERQTVSFTIQTMESDGLIFWQGEPGGRPLRGGDHFAIGLKNGLVEFRYEMGSGPAVIMSTRRVDDGQAHTVAVERFGRTGSLTIDNDMDNTVYGDSKGFLQMLNADGNIFVGGVSLIGPMTENKYSQNFKGCISNIVIHNKGPLKPRDAERGFNVEPCSGQ